MSETEQNPTQKGRDFEALERRYLSAGDWGKLADLYQSSVRNSPDQRLNVQRLLQAGNVFREKLKDAERANACYQQCVNVLRRSVDDTADRVVKSDLLCDLAKIYLDVLRDRERAIESYVQAFEFDPQKTHLMSVLGDIYAEREGWTDVVERFSADAKTVKDPSLKAKYLGEIADIYSFILTDPERALGMYQEILRQDPSNTKAIDALESLLIKGKRWADLAEFYKEIRTTTTDRDASISLLTKLGLIYKDKLHQALDAISIYEEILALQPNNFRIAAKLEELRGDRESWQKTIDDLDAELKKTKAPAARVPLLLRQSVIAEAYLGKTQLATERAAEAFRLAPGNAESLARAVELWTRNGSWDDLVRAYEKAAVEAPEKPRRADAWRKLARVALEKLKDPARAITAFESLLHLSPEDAAAREELVALYEGQRLFGPLENLLESNVARAPADQRPGLLLRLARLREKELGNPTSAIGTYEQLLEVDAHHPEALMALETLYPQERKWKELVDIYDRRAEGATSTAERGKLLLAQARTLEERVGDLKEAAHAYERALTLVEDPATIAARVEQIYFTQKMWDDLAGLYRRMLARFKTPEEQTKVLFKLAELYEQKLRQVDKAKACLTTILERKAGDVLALRKLERIAQDEGKWEDLIDVYRQQFEAGTDVAEKVAVYLKAGDTFLRQLKDERRAEGCYRRVLELDGGNRVALEFLIDFYRRSERYGDLLAVLEARVQGASESEPLSRVHFEIGRLLEGPLSREGDAVAHFEKAVSLDPNLSDARHALARLYGKRNRWAELARTYIGELEHTRDRMEGAELAAKVGRLKRIELAQPAEAIPYFRKALDLNGSDLSVLRDLTATLEQVGQAADAIPYYERLVKLSTQDSERCQTCLRIGRLFVETKGDRKEAAQWLERALEYEPNSQEAMDRLTSLYEELKNWEGLLGIYERILLSLSGVEAAAMQYRVGQLYEEHLGATDRALVSYQISTELDPTYVAPMKAMRRLLKAEENWGEYLKVTQQEVALTAAPAEKAPLLYEIGKLWREKFFQADRAVAAFEEVLKLTPGFMPALEELSTLHIDRRDLDSALKYTTQALEHVTERSHRIPLLERLGALQWEARKDPAAASKAYREILAIDPKNREAIQKLVDVCGRAKDFKGQLSALQMLLEIQSAREAKIGVLFQMAELWRGPLNSADNAAETLHALLRLDPANAPALDLLGEVSGDANQWNRVATQILKGILERNETDAFIHASLSVARTHSARFERHDRAVATLQEAAKAAGDRPDILEALLELYEKTGEALAMADVALRRAKLHEDPKERARALLKVAETWAEGLDNPRRAIEALEEARTLDPSASETLDRLIALQLRIGDWPGADQRIAEAIGNEPPTTPRIADLALQRASLLAERLNQPEEAARLLQAVLKASPENRPALSAAASLYEAQKDWKRLAQVRETLADLAHGTEAIEIRKALALLYEKELQAPAKAVKQYEMILRVFPRDRETLTTLERLHEKGGDAKALVSVLQQQITLARDPADAARIYRRLGEVWREQLKDESKASDFFERSLERDPKQAEIAAYLTKKYREGKRHRELAEVLKKTADLSPEKDALPLYQELADLWEKDLANPIAALEHLDRILKLDPNHRGALARMSAIHERNENYRALGWTLRRLGETASKPAEKIEALLKLGRIQIEHLASPHEAIQTFQRVLALEPGQAQALAQLRQLFGKDGRWADLAEILRTLARELKGAEAVPILKELGRIELDRLRQPASAMATFERLVGFDPSDRQIRKELVALYEQHGKFAALAASLETERKEKLSSDEMRGALKTLAAIYDDRLDKPEAAVECLEALLTTSPGDMDVLSRLEALYRRLGRAEDASKILEKQAMNMPHGNDRTTLLESIAYRYWTTAKNADDALRCYRALAEDPKEKQRALERIASIQEEQGDFPALAGTLRALTEEITDPQERAARCIALGKIEKGRLKNPKEAEKAFRQSLTLLPHDPDGVEALKELFVSNRAWPKAAEFLEAEIKATRDNRRRGAMLGELAELYRGPLKDAAKAATLYEELVRIAPHEIDAVAVLAELHFERGNWKEAAPLYDRLVKVTTSRKDPARAARLFFQLGTVCRKLAKTDEAIIYFNQSLTYDPNYSESIRALADLFYDLGQWDNALRMLQRVLSLGRPEDRAYLDQHYYRLLQTLHRLGHKEEAISLFEGARKELASHLGALKLVADLYFAAGRWKETTEMYEHVLRLAKTTPDRVLARHALADIALKQLKDAKAAREHTAVLLQEDPNHKGGLEIFLLLCEQAKEWPDAIHTLEQLSTLETDPEKLSRIFFRLGEIHDREAGDLKKAKEYYLRSIEVSHGQTPAIDALQSFCKTEEDWRDLGTLYEKTVQKLVKKGNTRQAANFQLALGRLCETHLRDPKRAAEAYRAALTMDRDSEGALLALARLLSRQADTQAEAVALYERLLSLAPERTETLREAALFYEKAGMSDRAFVLRSLLMAANSASPEERAFVDHARSQGKIAGGFKRPIEIEELLPLFPLEAQSPLARAFFAAGESLVAACAGAGQSAAMLSATDVVPDSTVKTLAEMGKQLDIETKKFRLYYSTTVADVDMDLTTPPTLAVGPGLYKLTPSAQKFHLTLSLLRIRLGYRVLLRLVPDTAEELVDALCALAQGRTPRREGSSSLLEALQRTLSKKDVKIISDLLAKGPAPKEAASVPTFLRALESAAIRSACVLSDDLVGPILAVGSRGPEALKELLTFLVSDIHLNWRERRLA